MGAKTEDAGHEGVFARHVVDAGKAPRACGIEVIQDLSALSSPLEGHLHRHRERTKILLDDGSRTSVHIVDYVDRRPGHRDAVAVALHTPRSPNTRTEDVRILLRRQFRYPVYLVQGTPLFLEVVAGIVEAPESPEDAAAREIAEEAGLSIDVRRVRRLGGPFFPSPGAFTDRASFVRRRSVGRERGRAPPTATEARWRKAPSSSTSISVPPWIY